MMSESERVPRSVAASNTGGRRLVLSPTESQGSFVREADAARTEQPFRLLAVTVDSVRLAAGVPLQVGERIDVTLTNPLQRVQAKTRGEVTGAATDAEGLFVADVALRVRLMPLMVSLLKMGIKRRGEADGDR